MNPLSLLGPSWLPKLGGLIAAIGAALRLAPLEKVSAWAPMIEALGLGILGLSVRQNNVSSEQAGAEPSDQAAAAGAKTVTGIVLLVGLALGSSGCAMNHPKITATTFYPDGRREERVIDIRSYALWPATTEVAKQKAALTPKLGLTTGSDLIHEDSTSTNSLEALKAIDSILGKIKP